MDEYLQEFHREDITQLLNNINSSLHSSIKLNLVQLQSTRPDFCAAIIRDCWTESKKWNQALLEAQKELIEGNLFLESQYQIKENCHVRFVNLPKSPLRPKGSFPNNDHIGLFVEVKGNAVRMSKGNLLEFKREYICNKCKHETVITAEYSKMYSFNAPRKCPNLSGLCKGMLQQKNENLKPALCIDYQEMRIQELFSDKNLPVSLLITLQDDLVDYCRPGESVTICGTIERRWKPFYLGKRTKSIIALRAISICKDEAKTDTNLNPSEQMGNAKMQWQETIDSVGQLNARDTIIKSICPEIHGMHMVKLAIALALCSGIEYNSNSGQTMRGQSHLLLVGDPGLAKSRLLKSASKISKRSVHTTGMGCSAAGLTAAAVKDHGEWQLEAGALVLADGGICCIDEFNLMRESDRSSIHEAMEQQTVSMAKAGFVCKLNTRCVILAATNPKNPYKVNETRETGSVNIGISPPLLSRFDIVLILKDERDPATDSKICDHILGNEMENSHPADTWDLERLQSHFLVAQNTTPRLTPEANQILIAYYQSCRMDYGRDTSRTTTRLMTSLNRLAQAHARLMFRAAAGAIDAIAVIRLMESSFGFGRLLFSVNVLKQELPLGPNEKYIEDLLRILRLDELIASTLEEYNRLNQPYKVLRNVNEGTGQEHVTRKKLDNENVNLNNLQNLFGFHQNLKKLTHTETNEKENQNLSFNLKTPLNENVEKVHKSSSNERELFSIHLNDSDDEALSQTVDATLFDRGIQTVLREDLNQSHDKSQTTCSVPALSLSIFDREQNFKEQEIKRKKLLETTHPPAVIQSQTTSSVPASGLSIFDRDLNFTDKDLEMDDIDFKIGYSNIDIDTRNLPGTSMHAINKNKNSPTSENQDTKRKKLSEKTLSKIEGFQYLPPNDSRTIEGSSNDRNLSKKMDESEDCAYSSLKSSNHEQQILLRNYDDDDDDLQFLETDDIIPNYRK